MHQNQRRILRALLLAFPEERYPNSLIAEFRKQAYSQIRIVMPTLTLFSRHLAQVCRFEPVYSLIGVIEAGCVSHLRFFPRILQALFQFLEHDLGRDCQTIDTIDILEYSF